MWVVKNTLVLKSLGIKEGMRGSVGTEFISQAPLYILYYTFILRLKLSFQTVSPINLTSIFMTQPNMVWIKLIAGTRHETQARRLASFLTSRLRENRSGVPESPLVLCVLWISGRYIVQRWTGVDNRPLVSSRPGRLDGVPRIPHSVVVFPQNH